MSIDFSKIRISIPDWVKRITEAFEANPQPFSELEISGALQNEANKHPELGPEELKGYHSEWAAFQFLERPDDGSIWHTHFGPMMTMGDTASPDIRMLDAEAISYWETRANSTPSPIMRARYADLVWDLKRAATNERPSHRCALLAIDAYDEAVAAGQYTMGMYGVSWLRRAFELSLRLGDKERARRIASSIFKFYDKNATPKQLGIWIFPFDVLYDQWDLLTSGQQLKLISDLEEMLRATSRKTEHDDFDPFGAQAAAERLHRHYKRGDDKLNAIRVIKTYGAAFQRLAEEASSMLATAWLQPIIERYEQEGLKEDAEELLLMLAEKGKTLSSEMKRVSVETTVSREDLNALVDRLIGGGDLNTSLANVANYFIPKVQQAKQFLEKMKTDAPLISMIPIVMVASDGHPSAKIGSLDEDADGRLHSHLGQIIGIEQPFLVHALAGIKERYAPTARQILEFLRLSPVYSRQDSTLVEEGLIAYSNEDFVKAIHVIVPQLEDALRNFLGSLEIPTLKSVRNHPGIMDAKSMNDVLGDSRLRQILTEDLWRYLTVVYVDKRGLNLRNDIAHGLVRRAAFNRSTADRVFHTLLALSLLRAAD